MKNKAFVLLIGILIISCNSKPKEFPIWKVTKKNKPTSYLVGVTDFLTEKEVKAHVSPLISKAFDSSSTLVTYRNLEKSDLLKTMKWIALGNNKTIKDSLPELYQLLKTEVKNLPITSDSIEVTELKPQFFLFDKLNHKPHPYLNVDQFWIKKAMPNLMSIKGFETLQNHYKTLAKKDSALPNFIKQNSPLINYYNKLFKEHEKIWREKLFDSIPKTIDPIDVYFTSPNEKNKYLQNKYTTWIKIADDLFQKSCFISLDIKYLYGDKNFRDHLLSNGYQLEKLN